MVELELQLNDVFRALSDPTRRAMLRSMAEAPRTVGELAAPFDISLAGASKHIQMLERANLIQRDVQGRVHTCRLNAHPLHAGAEWLRHYEHFWNTKLDALETILKAEDTNRPATKPPGKSRSFRRKKS
ncbi:MAG TPA: metalloregulator ArsR/SmtB family transcription factor [Gammaproteobacteria bacterium]|nr:metalloregulator ArsR/SmtB family transcription factor [Gammaproteobacteria bacterium]